MSDFAQAGLICTLQRLTDAGDERVEAQLCEHTRERPVTLVLPCHAGDLRVPALARMVSEIAGAPFLREVIVAMNGIDAASALVVGEIFEKVRLPWRVLWTDEPATRAAFERWVGAPLVPGKGTNVWAATGLAIVEGRSAVVVTQDCDVASFQRGNLARLCLAAVHPEMRYALAKMYYSRATDRLYGRVSRLFLAPLLQALVRVTGHQPLLDFLQSFRYPLAGECAMSCELAAALPMDPGWGFEVALLCEAFRHTEPRLVAQVDGGRDYDHRHHPLGDENGGLFRMSREIALALFAQLAEEGLPISTPFLDALAASFERESREALRRYHHLALMNGLASASDDAEAAAVFARAFAEAGYSFLSAGAGRPLPPWREILARTPEVLETLQAGCAS